MLTYCLFTPAAITAFRTRGDRGTVRPALALGVIGLAAGSLGAAVGAMIGCPEPSSARQEPSITAHQMSGFPCSTGSFGGQLPLTQSLGPQRRDLASGCGDRAGAGCCPDRR